MSESVPRGLFTADSGPQTRSGVAPVVSTLSGDPDMLELIQLFVDEIPDARSLRDFWQRRSSPSSGALRSQLKARAAGTASPRSETPPAR